MRVAHFYTLSDFASKNVTQKNQVFPDIKARLALPSSKINIMAKTRFTHFEFTYLEGYFRPESTLRGRIMRCRDFYDYLLCTYNPLMMIPIGQELGSEKPNRHACNATLRAVQFFDLVVVGDWGAKQNTITQSFIFSCNNSFGYLIPCLKAVTYYKLWRFAA